MSKTPCEEFADRIVDYVDGELPEHEARTVVEHLAECEPCRQTAEALRRSLGLAQVLWRDNLAESSRRVCYAHQNSVRLQNWCAKHTLHVAAASILLAIGGFFLVFLHQSRPPVTFEEVQTQVARAGTAAELLAATRIVAQCEGTESIVQQQYRYILREYADTPAAASIKADQNPKLGGMKND
jgi:anti-sigma factor RsiW